MVYGHASGCQHHRIPARRVHRLAVTVSAWRILGGAAVAWPLAVGAQQPAPPVIGFLHPGSPERNEELVAAFRRGLSETGHIEGRNVAIEYRWAHDQYIACRAWPPTWSAGTWP